MLKSEIMEVCLPEAQGDVGLLGPEQISEREGGETQEAPLKDRVRQSCFILHKL